MTANKNEPDKKPAGNPSAQAGSRPHATLDLKATEVTPPAPKPEAGQTTTAKSDAPQVAEASATSKAAASSSGASTSAADKPGASATAKPAGGTPPPSSPDPRPAPRGHGGFFTHVAAGLAGGLVALLAADILASQLGFETAGRPDATKALEQRIATLESNRAQRTVPTDVANRLAAAETKLAKLEQLDANVDGITKKQGQLDEGLTAVNDKLSAEGGDTGTPARVAKLEEQLSLMASAAERDPQSGRLPQLAAISGKLADLESTLATQLDALRKSVALEIDTRLASATEAGQTARSGTQRMDRELSTLKAESAEIATGVTALKSDSDRAAASLKTTQEEIKRLKADLDTRLASFAKAEDVSIAVGPINGKLTALQQDVQGVIKSEGDRKTTAERIVLSLELANLKRAIDRGAPTRPSWSRLARSLEPTSISRRSSASPSKAYRRQPSCAANSSRSPSRSSTPRNSRRMPRSSTGCSPALLRSFACARPTTAPMTRASRRSYRAWKSRSTRIVSVTCCRRRSHFPLPRRMPRRTSSPRCRHATPSTARSPPSKPSSRLRSPLRRPTPTAKPQSRDPTACCV